MASADRSFLNAVFIGEDRLGWTVERVKEKIKIILERGKTCGFTGENEGKRRAGNEPKRRCRPTLQRSPLQNDG